jgi:hypothetical protein
MMETTDLRMGRVQTDHGQKWRGNGGETEGKWRENGGEMDGKRMENEGEIEGKRMQIKEIAAGRIKWRSECLPDYTAAHPKSKN